MTLSLHSEYSVLVLTPMLAIGISVEGDDPACNATHSFVSCAWLFWTVQFNW